MDAEDWRFVFWSNATIKSLLLGKVALAKGQGERAVLKTDYS